MKNALADCSLENLGQFRFKDADESDPEASQKCRTRTRVAIGTGSVQHGSIPGGGVGSEDSRIAGAAHPGASGRGHHDVQGTGFGVPPSGGGGVFGEFDGRGGGGAPSGGSHFELDALHAASRASSRSA